MGKVCAGDVAIGGGSDMPIGGKYAYKAEAKANVVGGVCASKANADVEVDVEAELCIAHRAAGVKARWRFGAIMTCNVNEY